MFDQFKDRVKQIFKLLKRRTIKIESSRFCICIRNIFYPFNFSVF